MAVVGAAFLVAAARRVAADRDRAEAFFVAAPVAWIAALIVLVVDALRLDYNWATHATGSIEWALSLYAWIALLGAAALSCAVAWYRRRGFVTTERRALSTSAVVLGLFTTIATLVVVLVVYVSPHLG